VNLFIKSSFCIDVSLVAKESNSSQNGKKYHQTRRSRGNLNNLFLSFDYYDVLALLAASRFQGLGSSLSGLGFKVRCPAALLRGSSLKKITSCKRAVAQAEGFS